MDKDRILTSLAVRISIAVLTRTVFQPDEYFQSLEPAFHFVFGYGHLTWEWLSKDPIRSIIYPGLNIPFYWFLKIAGFAYPSFLGDLLLVGLSLTHCPCHHTFPLGIVTKTSTRNPSGSNGRLDM